MSHFFKATGKEVLADDRYYADAVDERAARFIAEACNRLSSRQEIHASVRAAIAEAPQ
ncbi:MULTISPECIES: hypothetical protein [Pacificimonas]|uniref:Uncharacterized protein n=1 Tax=Pacificimonas aurantium TaxID=1250540 RepID=A0ABS7WP16_9SPHN|nr:MULTISPECIES: hypothetical protein [Pacificimonas]MBZ6379856.1 hypothetical protein [Pacificimonas aurantium]